MADLVEATLELHYNGGWQDESSFVLDRGISVRRGISNEANAADPGKLALQLDNRTGRYSLRDPAAALYDVVGRGTQVRLSAGLAGDTKTVRFVGELVALTPQTNDESETVPTVTLEAAGILRRLGQGDQLPSPLRRHYENAFGSTLASYLPLEDGEDTVEAENVVPGLRGGAYAIGDGPDHPLRPGWAEDDSCPGSAPLPEWPVVEYFGWSVGSGVDPGVAVVPWQVHITARVPSGADGLWLTEWRTDGTLREWALRVIGGSLRVMATEADEDSPTSFTRTSANSIDDGEWHSIAASIGVDGSDTTVALTVDGDTETLSNINGRTAGRVTAVRPRPMYDDTTDQEVVGFGHVAVLGGRVAPADTGPAQGHAGERAVERMRRLAGREDVRMRFPGLESDEDTFDRAEASGWGETELAGETWATVVESSGSANYSVDDGVGQIRPQTTDVHAVATVPGPDDVDLLTRVRGRADHFGLVLRFSDIDNFYEVSFNPVTSLVQAWVVSGGTWTEIVELSTPTQFQQGRWYWLRAQMVDNRLRVKAWQDGHAEPTHWRIDETDDTHTSGRVGAFAYATTSDTVAEFSTWRSTAADTDSGRCGVQQLSRLVDNLEDAANVDGGVLHESRDALGLQHRPLATLYNADTDVTLSWTSSHVSAPLDPTIDDQGITNDVTADRVDGAAARAEVTDGPLGVDSVGRRATSRQVNVAGDGQLLDIARWAAHLGTWDDLRIPSIRTDLRGLADRTGGDAVRASLQTLDPGGRMTVQGPPTWLSREDLDQQVLGVSEEISQDAWHVDWHTTPAGPYTVGTYANDDELPGEAQPQRYDTAGCETVENFAAGTDTQLVVTTTSGPAWTRNSGGLQLDGSVGNEATTPDAAALDVTGDITIIAHVTTDQWDTGSFLDFVRKWDFAGNNSYRLRLSSGDALRIHWTEDGSTDMTLDSSVAVPVPTPSPQVLAAELDVDNGSSQHAARFWVADSVDGPWTELGTAQTGSGVTSIFAGAADLMVDSGSGFARTTRELQVWSGLAISDPDNATLVAGPQFEREQAGTTSFVDAAGLTWTVSGGAEIVDGDLPADLAVSGVRLRARWATAEITREVADTFTRTVASGWGTADTGETWTTHGSADFSVDGAEGVVENAPVGTPQAATVGDDYEDLEILVAVTFSGTGAGDGGPAFRFASTSNHYQVILYSPDLGASLEANAVVDGTVVTLQTEDAPFTTAASTKYWVRARIEGDRIRARTWEDGNSEPTSWLIDVVDDRHTEPGAAGVQHFDGGDGSLVTNWDDFEATDLRPRQTIAVDQTPANGVAKTIDAGESVSLWQPARYAL